MNKKRGPFDLFYKELNMLDGGLNQTLIGSLTTKFNKILDRVLSRKNTFWNRFIHTALGRRYRVYIKSGFEKYNKNIRGWRQGVLKDKFKRELKKRISDSIDLISYRATESKAECKRRLLGYLTSPQRNNAAQALRMKSVIDKTDKRLRFTVTDQSRKMVSSFNKIVAEHYGAIGFYWRGRRDKREVGNPTGLYPEATNPKVHGDHWERNNQFYFYEDSWALKRKYVNANAKGFKLAKFEDGLPGEPIGCRCSSYNIYELEDIDEKFLTLRGKTYLERKAR